MYRRFVKPVLDFISALVGLLLLSPLILIITVVLAISNNGKPFFYQERPGKNGRIFTIVKFRTMNDKRDTAGKLLPDMDRITPVGAFIRNNSLDELLQLVNVLTGDMSLIGPRPLLTAYLPLYNAEQARRHEVKPGITGWAQVNGRNAISWPEKFALDVWYVNNISFVTDMKILILTVKKVFQQTMQRFMGNP